MIRLLKSNEKNYLKHVFPTRYSVYSCIKSFRIHSYSRRWSKNFSSVKFKYERIKINLRNGKTCLRVNTSWKEKPPTYPYLKLILKNTFHATHETCKNFCNCTFLHFFTVTVLLELAWNFSKFRQLYLKFRINFLLHYSEHLITSY